jgi:hypothetical protein
MHIGFLILSNRSDLVEPIQEENLAVKVRDWTGKPRRPSAFVLHIQHENGWIRGRGTFDFRLYFWKPRRKLSNR